MLHLRAPLDATRRELLEEAGAQWVTLTPLGSWHCVPLKKVCRRFEAIGRPELAELYRLAAEMRTERKGTN